MKIFEFKNSRGEQATEEEYRFRIGSPKVETKTDEDDKDGKKRRFAGVGYTGDMITGHYYWGNVVFDLSLMNVPSKMPILRDHYAEKIVGFSDKFGVSDERGLELEGHLSTSTSFGQEVIMLSDEGFPWQMSVRIHPARIEELKAGGSTVVNGRQITGPAYIFRESQIVETSFTPTGWDSKTSATALSRVQSQEEDTQMSKELEDKNKALETELATMREQFSKAQELLTAFAKKAQEEKKQAIVDAFAKVGKVPTDEMLAGLSALSEGVLKDTLDALASVPASKEELAPTMQFTNMGLFQDTTKQGRTDKTPEQAATGSLFSLCDQALEAHSKRMKR